MRRNVEGVAFHRRPGYCALFLVSALSPVPNDFAPFLYAPELFTKKNKNKFGPCLETFKDVLTIIGYLFVCLGECL